MLPRMPPDPSLETLALPRPGDRVAERYRVVREIGRGAMGVVFEVVHEKLDRRCALKLLRPQAQEDEGAVRRFEREAKILAKLSSPNLVQVLDVDCTEAGLPYLVMELLEGETLEARLQRGPIAEDDAIAWTLDLCAGAEAAHGAGVVHRDLKPSNVVLTKSGAKIVDFGVAAFVSGSMDGSTASVAGTPRTMSPEQLLGERVGPESDVFAIAVVAYRMLAGRYPFEAESMAGQMLAIMKGHVPLSEVCPVSTALSEVISSALERDPGARIGSAKRLAERIEEARTRPFAPASPARPPSPSPVAHESEEAASAPAPQIASPIESRRSPIVGIAALLGLMGILGIGAWALSSHPKAELPAPTETSTPPPSARASEVATAAEAPESALPKASPSPVAPSVAATSSLVPTKPPPDGRGLATPKPSTKPVPTASVNAPSGNGFPAHL
jgi:eukaryotic-like serine/threonine-protein kinase